MSFTETLDAMRGLSSKWPQTTRKLVEDKANGTAVIDVLKKEIPGIIPVEPFGGKVVRAHATTAVAEAGNVYIPAASACPWVMDFVKKWPRSQAVRTMTKLTAIRRRTPTTTTTRLIFVR